METLQENQNFIDLIWHSLFVAASVMAILVPFYFWRHFCFQDGDGALISKMKPRFHGPMEYSDSLEVEYILALYVRLFSI